MAAVMRLLSVRYLFVGVLMVAAAGAAIAFTPTATVPESAVADLAKSMPTRFGPWKEVESAVIQMDLTPRAGDEPDLSSIIYDQVFMRTYRRDDGAIVMLALAYGREQKQELKIHRPELCYVAQGFQVKSKKSDTLSIAGNDRAVTRIVARNDRRLEPVTYWIRIGDKFVKNAWETRGTIFQEGIRGRVPDGILVRVSSVSSQGNNLAADYSLHDAFVTDLLRELDPQIKRMLVGSYLRR
jgi:EpsI family protein